MAAERWPQPDFFLATALTSFSNAPGASCPVAAQTFSRGIKGLQERVKSAAKSYLTHGNTAVAHDKDWEEF